MSEKASQKTVFVLAVLAAQCSVCWNLLCEFATKQLALPSLQCLLVSVLGSLFWLVLVASLFRSSGLRSELHSSLSTLCCCRAQSWREWSLFALASITPELAYLALSLSLFLLNTGDSVALFHGSRLISTAIFAPLLFSEPIRMLDALRVLACVAGVVLISEPPFLFGSAKSGDGSEHARSSGMRTLGVISALFCGLCFASGNASIRGLSNSGLSPTAVMIGRFLGGTVVLSLALCAALSSTRHWSADDVELWAPLSLSEDWRVPLTLLALSLLFPMVAFLFTFVFSHGELNRVTLVCSSSIATAFLFQSLLFGELLDLCDYSGGLLILLASVAAPAYQLCVHPEGPPKKRVVPHSELDPLAWDTRSPQPRFYGLESERV